MNHQDAYDPRTPSTADDAHLRLQLRGLRVEQQPASDLWPGIAARIEQAAQTSNHGTVVPMRRRGGASRFAPLALAASLVLVVGVAWQQRPDFAVTPQTPSARLIHREADAMTREYDAALREYAAAGVPVRAGSGDAIAALDQSAAQIRSALARDPEARFLLDRLRSTYEKRLALSQRNDLT